MTIYECLGIDHILLDEQIPIDLIIENIDSEDLKFEAESYFRSINSVCLRASIARGEHYLQVIEIDLDKPEYIREISFIIQKAIKYRVLFVFVYKDRYLLLRRSFSLTMTTENVYTYNASFCSDWIYEEYLNMDILYSLKFRAVKEYAEADENAVELLKTNNDNGDYILFRDILSCAEGLNRCVIESDCVSGRWFLDWLQFHAAGQRVEVEDIIHALRDQEAFIFIEDELFFDKGLLKVTLSNLDNSKYDLPMDHTGKSPMRYFEEIEQCASREDVQELLQLIVHDQIYNSVANTHEYYEEEYIPSELKPYCRGSYHGYGYTYVPSTSSPSRSPFVDRIIELYQYRNTHLIKYLDLSGRTLLGLRRAKLATLEQVALHTFDELNFLPFKNKVELMQLMNQFGFRLKGCTKNDYPTINEFIQKKIKCQDCGGEIEAYDWTVDNRMCCSCSERHDRLDSEKVFSKNVSNVTIHTGEESSRIEMRFSLSTDAISLDVQLIDAQIITHEGKEYQFDLTSGQAKPDPVTIKGWKTNEYSLTSGVSGKLYLKDIDLIRTEYVEPKSGSTYTFIVKIACEDADGRTQYKLVPYDYLDHDAEASKATEHFFELLRTVLEKHNQEDLCSDSDKLRLEEEQRAVEEQRRLEEDRREAEEQRHLEEERRKAEELRRLEEERRKAEEQRRLEEERRKAEEQRRLAEEHRKAEELRRLEEERLKAEEQRRLAEEHRKAEELRRLEEERRKAEELRRLEEKRRKAEELRRLEEERRKAEELRRLEEERRNAEELRRLEEKRRKAEELRRLEEERRKAEEQRRLEEERLKAEELKAKKPHVERLAQAIDVAKSNSILRLVVVLNSIYVKCADYERYLQFQEEQRLLEEERRRAEELRRLEEERRKREELNRLEEERRKAEEQRRLEEERRKAEELRRLEEERRKAEELRRLEEERRKREEQHRLEEERRKREEQHRLEEELARRKDYYRTQKLCQHCGGKFKGLFKKVCSNCGRSKDY